MPAIAGSKIPALRLHRKTGQAVVTLTNPRGVRRDYYLGKFENEESRTRYQALIARWVGAGHEHPDVARVVAGVTPLNLQQLVDRFVAWAKTYYVLKDGTASREVANLERACELLTEKFADEHPTEFGPSKLTLLRDSLVHKRYRIEKDGLGREKPNTGTPISRNYINATIRRIKQMFKWAEAHELVPASCYHRLATVPSLKAGRCNARETTGLCPVTEAQVKATVPHLMPQVAALVWFCWYTGARMGEAVQLATRYVDMKKAVWLFTPAQHKNAHRGKDRVIPIGKEAQRELRPFLQVVPDRQWFRPCDAMAQHNAERLPELSPKSRETRLAKNARRRTANPEWAPGEEYTTNAVQIAIRRACKSAGVAPWTPHMLRHAALSRIREERGLEAAAAIGGHWTLDVTQLYTKVAQQKLAVEVMRDLG